MTQDVLPAVKHSSALLRVQLVDKVSGEVLVAILVSGKKQTDEQTSAELFCKAPQTLRKRGAGSPQHQTSLDAGLHLLQQMLHVGLSRKTKKRKYLVVLRPSSDYHTRAVMSSDKVTFL